MGPFDSLGTPEYYVYQHIHPETKEVAYIGHGKGSRAWQYGTYRGKQTGAYGHRKEQHTAWCQALVQEGYLPHEWTEILHRKLIKEEACKKERILLRNRDTLFNSPLGLKNLAMSGDDIEDALAMRAHGYSYKTIGTALNFGTMVVWRALNGINENRPL